MRRGSGIYWDMDLGLYIFILLHLASLWLGPIRVMNGDDSF